MRRAQLNETESLGALSTDPRGQWQWWRISFSTDDAKNMASANRVSRRDFNLGNADIAGYSARKVREVEVIKAAREESNNVLLVYANEDALKFPEGPHPPQLQVIIDIHQ